MRFEEIPWRWIFAEKPFRPKFGTGGAHRQTLAAYLWPRRFFSGTPSEQTFFDMDDGSRVLAECQWQKDREAHPALIVVHGMEGSSRSGYALGTADKALCAGFNAVRLNLRNCGGFRLLNHRGCAVPGRRRGLRVPDTCPR